ncbi:MAG: ribosome-associated translation inhibitor RaiA [Clostridia bacterium]|nr:ribosome-associated translation inhibitor RaiA [Clostridia bacterium]
MNIKLTGKDLKATDAIKDYVEKKVERLVKYFGEDFEVNATIKCEKSEQIADIMVNADSDTYKAVTSHRDLYAAIDKDIDILEGQIRKMKTKKEKQNKEDSIKQKEMMNMTGKVHEVENEVIKTIYYEAKPMSVEDAILKLQEKPQDIFYTFINVDTSKVNVVFKLKNSKNYGIVEPE